MVNVTQRVKQFKQPPGGFVNPRSLEVIELGDGGVQHLDHKAENAHASSVGSAVDYLSRLANGSVAREAFSTSLRGAVSLYLPEGLDQSHMRLLVDRDYLNDRSTPRHMKALGGAYQRLEALKPGVLPDDDAIRAAVHLVGYDVVTRAGAALYEGKHGDPDAVTIAHIRTMVERASSFFSHYGPVTADGFYPVTMLSVTELITGGDGDFLTADTMWDFKVSVKPPTKDNTLQLLVYLIMGRRSGQAQFEKLTHLGVYNPRLNAVYRIALADIPSEVFEAVARDVIGYENATSSDEQGAPVQSEQGIRYFGNAYTTYSDLEKSAIWDEFRRITEGNHPAGSHEFQMKARFKMLDAKSRL